MKIIDNLVCGEEVQPYYPSRKHSGDFNPGLPDMVVLHYTGGGSVASAVSTLRNPEVKASAHLVIGRDGSVTQLIPFNKVAWHAGKSEWKNRTWLNQYSIGVELDNAGKLVSVGNGRHRTWYGAPVAAKDVYRDTKGLFWHRYTETQMYATQRVIVALFEAYPRIDTVVRHEDIAPGRKIDPGPAFNALAKEMEIAIW